MLKRVISIIIAGAMLLSGVSAMAAGEIPDGDALLYYNDGSNVTDFLGYSGVLSVDGDSIKMSADNATKQIALQNLSGSINAGSGEIAAMLQFRFMAGQEDKYVFFEIKDEVTSKALTTFAITSGGKIGGTSDGNWVADKEAVNSLPSSKKYVAGTWYDVAMAFTTDSKLIYYLDGKEWFTASVPAEFNPKSTNITVKPTITFNDKFSDTEASTKADFWFDDIMWTHPGEKGFYAFSDSEAYSTDTKNIELMFTEAVASDTLSLASGVKIVRCDNGDEIDGVQAEFDGFRKMNISFTDDLEGGYEYRIELPEFKSISGNDLYGGNVYFTTANVKTQTEIDTDFTGFANDTDHINAYYLSDSSVTNSYYTPDGWYPGFRWATQDEAWIEAATDSESGTAMRFGKKTTGDYSAKGTASVYYPMTEKLSEGKVVISFDIKPETYAEADASNSANLGFIFTMYPEMLTAAERDYTDGNGNSTNKIMSSGVQKSVFGIMGNRLGFFTSNIFDIDAANRWNAFSSWVDSKDYSVINPSTTDWHNVKIEIDYNTETIKYTFDGYTYTSSALLEALGLADGFGGIGFYSNYYAQNASTLIDNIKIVAEKAAGGLVTQNVLAENFDSYTTSNASRVGTTNIYRPESWQSAFTWDTQTSVTVEPVEKSTGDTALKIKKAYHESNDGGSTALYRALDKKYNTNVVTVEFDFNAVSAPNKDSNSAAKQFMFNAYSDALSAEEYGVTTETQGSNKVLANAKHITGINGGALAVFKDTGALSDGSGYINADYRDWGFARGEWHHIKVMFDYNAGTVTTYIDDTQRGSSYALSSFGLESGISGIGFSTDWFTNGADAEVYVDNIMVTHTEESAGTKVKSIRFESADGTLYGVSDKASTKVNKMIIGFFGDVDESSLEDAVALSDGYNYLALKNGVYNAIDFTYTVELDEALTKDTNYTLTVDGVTKDGASVEGYTAYFKTSPEGVFEIEDFYITKNGTDITNSEALTLSAGDTLVIGAKIRNTTGEDKSVSFMYATYNGSLMSDIQLDAVTTGDELSYYEKEYKLTVTTQMAEEMTHIKGFLWKGLDGVIPLTKAVYAVQAGN